MENNIIDINKFKREKADRDLQEAFDLSFVTCIEQLYNNDKKTLNKLSSLAIPSFKQMQKILALLQIIYTKLNNCEEYKHLTEYFKHYSPLFDINFPTSTQKFRNISDKKQMYYFVSDLQTMAVVHTSLYEHKIQWLKEYFILE